MRKCVKCGKVMVSDLRLKVNGGGYGIVVRVDEKQKATIIDDVKVAVCPECGYIEMYLEDLTNLKDQAITSSLYSTKYVLTSFEINTFAYILKPLTETKLEHLLNRVFNYFISEQRIFIFSYYKEKFFILLKTIMYLEKAGRILYIYTSIQKEPFKTYMTMAEVWQQLKNSSFIQIHASLIINSLYVASIHKNIVTLISGEKLYIYYI